jgi:hypothetical protein
MKIVDPVLVPDVSIWCDHINAQEFVATGCQSVVVGLYSSYDASGKKTLSPVSLKQCRDTIAAGMVLQAYYWDDITQDPVTQADWVAQTIQTEGLPIKWVWADQEQWWIDWRAWQMWRVGKIDASAVPVAPAANISIHNEAFVAQLNSKFPQSGVYTNQGFVSSWAPGMNSWLPKYKAWVPQYGKQPKEAIQMTWATLKESWLPNYDIALAPGQLPGQVVGHQFTGDVCILPGSYNQANQPMPLDVSVFSQEFITSLGGAVNLPQNSPQEAPPAPINAYKVIYPRINVRSQPSATSAWVRYAVQGEVLNILNISNGWAQLADGTYVFAAYISK